MIGQKRDDPSIIVPDLSSVIVSPTSVVSNSVLQSIINGGCYTVENEIILPSAVGNHKVQIFDLEGAVEILALYAEVTDTLADCEGAFFDLTDLVTSADITESSSGALCSALEIGSLLTKIDANTVALEILSAVNCNILEPKANFNPTAQSFILLAGNKTDCTLNFNFTVPALGTGGGKLKVIVHYKPINYDTGKLTVYTP